jgi:UPF0716 protein FxsA
VGRRVRTFAALWVLAELAVFVALVAWIGIGWTLLAAVATSALGWALLARQGARTLGELREQAALRRPAGRALGDAALVALGGLLMVLPGFLGDLVGLLCLLPGTRALPRALVARGLLARLPGLGGPVRVRSTRAPGPVPDDVTFDVDPSGGWRPIAVIEGEVVEGDVVEGDVVEGDVVEGDVVEGDNADGRAGPGGGARRR